MSLPAPSLFAPSLRLLEAVGRRGTFFIALSIMVGLAIPPLAALAKPLLMPCVYVMLVMSFMRMDTAQLRTGGRLKVVGAALLWIMALPPLLLTIVLLVVPISNPDLLLGLAIQASSPPIMSSAAIAILLGFDPTLTLLVMVVAMLVMPFTAPAIVHGLSGAALELEPLALALRLGLMLAATAVIGFGLRRLAGPRRLSAWRGRLDGINVLLMSIMAVGFMDGIMMRFLAEPARLMGIASLAFCVCLTAVIITTLLFRRVAGEQQGLMIGVSSGMRNMMVLVTAAGGAVPGDTWLYVSLSQFPIYLLPLLIKPVANLMLRRAASG
ncbi:hypothetical protein ACLBXM_05730 [Xanthobacteraceae bacterium A53D]